MYAEPPVPEIANKMPSSQWPVCLLPLKYDRFVLTLPVRSERFGPKFSCNLSSSSTKSLLRTLFKEVLIINPFELQSSENRHVTGVNQAARIWKLMIFP